MTGITRGRMVALGGGGIGLRKYGSSAALVLLFGVLLTRGFREGPTFDYHCYRNAGIAWSAGHSLYAGEDGVYLYAPVFALLFRPLAAVTPETGYVVWTLLSTLALLGGLLLSARALRPGVAADRGVMLMALLLAMIPAASNFKHGNANSFLVLFLAVAFWAWSRRRAWWGGLGMSLAIAMKVAPGLFLVWLLLKKEWRLLGGTLAGLGLWLVVVPVLTLGPGAAWSHSEDWLSNVILPAVTAGDEGPKVLAESGSSIPRVLAALVGEPSVEHPEQPTLGWMSQEGARSVGMLIAALLLLLTFGVVYRSGARVGDRGSATVPGWSLEFGLLLATLLLASPVSRAAHFMQLIPFFVVLSWMILAEGVSQKRARNALLVAIALYATLTLVAKGMDLSSKSFFPLTAFTIALWIGAVGVLLQRLPDVATTDIPGTQSQE